MNYRQLTSDLLESKHKKIYTTETLDKTTHLLALNPEFYTIWNYRREILSALFANKTVDPIKLLEDDLKLVMAQLKLFPKCYWIWGHRIWCLFQLQELNAANWKFELLIVSKLLEMDSRNFLGWQYRRFVIDNIEKNIADAELLKNLKINVDEFNFTTSKINNNISNFSAWHNRTKLIPKIFSILHEIGDESLLQQDDYKLFQNPHTLLVHELDLVKTGMFMDSDDTSVWLYLWWLLTNDIFVSYLHENSDSHSYEEIIQGQLNTIAEVNELEKDDHEQGWDNVWCLKTTLLLNSLIKREQGNATLLDEDAKVILQKLIEYDPLRKGRYLDQLNGVSPIL